MQKNAELYKKFSGGYSEGEPPVPIPNTVVKPFSADDTSGETSRESKSLPESLSQGRLITCLVFRTTPIHSLAWLYQEDPKNTTEGFTFGTKPKEYMGKGERSMKKNKYSGSSFDDFLKEEGIYEEVKTLAQEELASERYKRYPVVIYKDLDSDYSMLVPDLPGCYTAGDTITDVLQQAVKAIELRLEGMLRDGDSIPEPKDIAFHENNPEYADGLWKTITIKFPELRHYPVIKPYSEHGGEHDGKDGGEHD